uniref:Si:ch73-95l15.5 n=1 Tax=Haplochromis burtoni TaxID=8153 RepID=A0A3Q2VK66_HAPBU
MSSRSKNDQCQICGGALQGNQRRWLFGGQNKKTGQPRTPTGSLRGGSRSQSSQSSSWSTLSLGSSVSLSKSLMSVSSPSKSVDLLTVLTHILGQSVPRGGGQGEFVCGKCVCLLERVFKFDTVIARVRVLSSERLQKLTHERDKIRQWVRQNYCHRHLQDFQSRSSTSEEEGEVEKEGYREMLKENMALSEYECWSEKWDTCPYFIRTGKRCRKGKGCEGCDSLRVSDSDYESVCGVPRHMPFQPFSPLSQDRSQSVPLHWQRVPSVNSSPASLAGSSLSLRAPSHTESIQSLDSLDGNDPFDSASDQSVNFMLRELRSIGGKPVSSPSGSKIPVLGKRDGRYLGKIEETASPTVTRVLNFRDVENGGDEENGDVLTLLRDEFMPLHREKTAARVHHGIRHLKGQLDQAASRIRTLEAELKSLGLSLHSRERLIQECTSLISRLCAALEALRSEITEKEKSTEKEIEALRKAGRDRERDLDTLNTVLQCNQDIISDLRVALGEKEQLLKEVEKERELWRQRDGALTAVLQEKEALICTFKEQLEALSDSVTGQQSGGGGAELAAMLKDQEESSATLCQESQQESHSRTVSSLTAQLRDARQELREKEKKKKEADRALQNDREDGERGERRLRDSLEKRDKLIEQILLDAEERDHLFRELQQNLQNKREPLTAVKHTL